MTQPDTKTQIEQLVYAYDLHTLGIQAVLPDDVKSLALTEDMLSDNIPALEERADLIAYGACLYSYLNQNPKGTREEFNAAHDPEALEKVSVQIRDKLNATIEVKDLIEYHSQNSARPTRIDMKRQVKG